MTIIHLIPVPLTGSGIEQLSQNSIQITHQLTHFLAEKAKAARQYIRMIKHPKPQKEIEVREISDENFKENCNWIQELADKNVEIGLISEAGLPCVADPGTNLVNFAHKNNITVIPYPGPNSIMMALMSSGLNGQHFCFHGYLPQKKDKLKIKLAEISRNCSSTSFSQIFMETPYRNISLLESIMNHISSELYLSISSGLGTDSQVTRSLKIREWRNMDLKYLHHSPAVFVLNK